MLGYVFAHPRSASYKLARMILPQLEVGTHGVDVVGMFFFDDNNFILRSGDPVGERLARVAEEQGILLMMCDMCALERNLAEGEPRWCDALMARGEPSRERYALSTLSRVSKLVVSPTCMPPSAQTRPIK